VASTSSTQTTPEGLYHGGPPAPGQVPLPPSERHHWLLAAAVALLGAGLLALVLTGAIGGAGSQLAPPPVLASTPTPVPAAAGAGAPAPGSAASAGTIVGSGAPQQSGAFSSYYEPLRAHISRHWMEGFYPIYATAQRTFAVNWLLIASIHRQESAFSTAPGIYYGLNFAHCCGGPMQFNVRNRPVSTWSLVSDSYLYGVRPASYDHRTAAHPSIYDDFDAIMAAAHLLSADGAGMALDQSAWDAAYDYYGHDEDGVTYADQVLARAIGWSQHGFCINCGLEAAMVSAVHAAYGAPVLAALTRPPARSAHRRRGH
jgi:hypothetical protein